MIGICKAHKRAQLVAVERKEDPKEHVRNNSADESPSAYTSEHMHDSKDTY